METETNKMTKQPSYRFAGFTEAWEQRKLGDILQTLSFKQFLKEPEQDGRYEIIQQGNEPIIGYANGAPCNDYENTVIFGDHTLSLYKPKSPFFVATDGVRIVKGKNNFNGFYLMAMLEKYKPQNEGYKRYYSILADQECYLTDNTNEQRIIGQYFAQLDNLITLHQRKLEVLKEQKKTYLKLLFPAKRQTKPALRFTGFEDEWKEVKLGEVLKKNNKKNRDLAINNVESISNKLGFIKQTEQFEDYSVASADLSNYYVISEKQFAYNPSRINVGSIAYKKEGDTLSVVSPLYVSFSTVENIDDSYLWYWFRTSLFDSQRAIYSEGGVRDTLSFNRLSNIELIFPALPEQETIGSFFRNLDKAITKQEKKVNQLKESKQTLLRKMFI